MTDLELKRDFVLANKMLVREGILDGLGHISVRDPDTPERFYMLKAVAPMKAKEEDIIVVGLDGEVKGASHQAVAERFIHAGIYAVRHDINAICHSHNEYVLALTSMGVDIKPVFHLGCFLGEGVSYFEPNNAGFLVDSRELGEALAHSLGQGRLVVLRFHGYVLVARSLQELVAVNIYLVTNVKMQLLALMAGREIPPIPERLARKEAEKTLLNPRVLRRVWDHLIEKHSLH